MSNVPKREGAIISQSLQNLFHPRRIPAHFVYLWPVDVR